MIHLLVAFVFSASAVLMIMGAVFFWHFRNWNKNAAEWRMRDEAERAYMVANGIEPCVFHVPSRTDVFVFPERH